MAYSCFYSLAQGEGGPPGKIGLEGGLGPLGSPGPRGMTTQGKGVRSSPPFTKYWLVSVLTQLVVLLYLPSRVHLVPEEKREIRVDPENR